VRHAWKRATSARSVWMPLTGSRAPRVHGRRDQGGGHRQEMLQIDRLRHMGLIAGAEQSDTILGARIRRDRNRGNRPQMSCSCDRSWRMKAYPSSLRIPHIVISCSGAL
jgi:hypothetical protein